jgi:hypothetical protein
MSHVQRDTWNGSPEHLSDAFRMTKPKGEAVSTAVCEVWSHPFGCELRLTVDGHGLMMTSVVRSAPDMVETSERWQAALTEKGLELIGSRRPPPSEHQDREPYTHERDAITRPRPRVLRGGYRRRRSAQCSPRRSQPHGTPSRSQTLGSPARNSLSRPTVKAGLSGRQDVTHVRHRITFINGAVVESSLRPTKVLPSSILRVGRAVLPCGSSCVPSPASDRATMDRISDAQTVTPRR